MARVGATFRGAAATPRRAKACGRRETERAQSAEGLAPRLWLHGAASVSALLVVATVVAELDSEMAGARHLLQLHLGRENNPAAWWSGALLALAALHAFDGGRALAGRAPTAARGWALIAGLLLFLSADEIGSLHERVSWLGVMSPLANPWPALAPAAALLGGVFAVALRLFWRAGNPHRRAIWPIVIGFGCFGLVAAQEFAEHRVVWAEGWQSALRVAAEEGTELVGILTLLYAATGAAAGLSRSGGDTDSGAALSAHRRSLLLAGAALAAPLAILSVAFEAQRWGNPADWLAATAFLAAGLALLAPTPQGRERANAPSLGLAALCCAASVGVVSISPHGQLPLESFALNTRIVALAGMAGGIVLFFGALRAARRRALLGVVAIVALTGASAATTRLEVVYLVSQVFGLAVFAVTAGRVGEPRPARVMRRGSQPAFARRLAQGRASPPSE